MFDDPKPSMGPEPPLTEAGRCSHGVCASKSTTLAWNHSLLQVEVNLSTDGNATAANSTGDFDGDDGNLLSDEAQASLIVLYALTTFFSILGNVLVVIVFTKGRRSRTDIRPFLINLAMADLIMALFCMPFTFTYAMTRIWIFSAPMCPIVLFMQHLSVSASVFTNMAIGIDRFLVVTFPLRARMTSQRAKYTICIIWVCAVGLSSVQLIVARASGDGPSMGCDERWPSPDARRTFTMFVLFITYIIPLVILSVTYSIVSILLWKRTAPGNAHEGRDLQQLRAKRKVIKMLVLVVIMFGVCWLPLHTFFLVLDFSPHLLAYEDNAKRSMVTLIFYIAFWMAMSNSCANPIIYGFTNDSFRSDLAALCYLCFPFCICFKKMANRQLSSTYDSVYNKRFSTIRKTTNNSCYRQAACRNGSKVYIELQRDMARGRSVASMNDFYKESVEREKRNSYVNGRLNNSRHHRFHPHFPHRNRHRHPPPFWRTDSEDSTTSLTSGNKNFSDRPTSTSSYNGSDRRSPNSPSYSMKREFSFPGNNGTNGSYKLNPLPEIESSDCADFNTV